METTCIAVLGDLHGHLTLAYRLVRRWQSAHDRRVSLILQVGDLGAFPDPGRGDRSTRRFARRDPDELGFARYYAGDEEARAILGPDAPEDQRIDAPLIFIQGNHEDFDFLRGLPSHDGDVTPVDAFGRVCFLGNGKVCEVSVNGLMLRIAGFGGIAPAEDRKRTLEAAYHRRDEAGELLCRREPVDVLLTHDVPYGCLRPDEGSLEVMELIRGLRPTYHFFGHAHLTGRQVPLPETTRSFHLNEVGFASPWQLNAGCFGILSWNGDGNHEFSFVQDDWLHEFWASYR